MMLLCYCDDPISVILIIACLHTSSNIFIAGTCETGQKLFFIRSKRVFLYIREYCIINGLF